MTIEENILDKMGAPKDPLERLKWIREKEKEVEEEEKKVIEVLNELENEIGTPKSGLKEAAQKQIEKWKANEVDVESKLLHFLLELRLYLDITRLRVSVLQNNPLQANQIAKQLKKTFGIDLGTTNEN